MSEQVTGAGNELCKLCDSKLSVFVPRGSPTKWFAKCDRCGEYWLTSPAFDTTPEPFIKEHLHLISAVTRWHSERGQKFVIEEALLTERSEFEARILSQCPRNTQEKMDSILRYIAQKSSPGVATTIDKESDYPLFYCKGKEELKFWLGSLEFLTLLGEVNPGDTEDHWELMLSADGWRKVEELAKPNIESTQAFVAMWFDPQMASAYSDGIKKLEGDTGFTMFRIDMEPFNDKICDRILAEIRRSRFLIADVTGHRQGVYFEAGFAMGLGIPVIWTCRKDQIEACHFDTRQYNHVPWENPEELRSKLRDRILATIGQATKSSAQLPTHHE